MTLQAEEMQRQMNIERQQQQEKIEEENMLKKMVKTLSRFLVFFFLTTLHTNVLAQAMQAEEMQHQMEVERQRQHEKIQEEDMFKKMVKHYTNFSVIMKLFIYFSM